MPAFTVGVVTEIWMKPLGLTFIYAVIEIKVSNIAGNLPKIFMSSLAFKGVMK